MKNWSGLRWFLTVTVPFAFLAFYGLIIAPGTVRGEKVPALWLTVGIISALTAIYGLYKTSKNSN